MVYVFLCLKLGRCSPLEMQREFRSMTALHYTAPYAFTCRANPMNWNDRVDIYIYLEEETQRSTLVFINRSLSIDHSGAAASAVGCYYTATTAHQFTHL